MGEPKMIIVLDGMDNTFKTTISKKLEYYGFRSIPIPYDRDLINYFVRTNPDPKLISMMFLIDMVNTVSKLNPRKNYVLDRSFVSTLIYQGTQISERHKMKYDDSIEYIWKQLITLDENFPKIIHKIYLLVVNDEDYLKRTGRKRDNIDIIYDNLEFQRKIRNKIFRVEKFLKEKNLNIEIIDTSNKTSDEITEYIVKDLNIFL